MSPQRKNVEESERFRAVPWMQPINRCTFCGAEAHLWQRSVPGTDTWESCVMCSNDGSEDVTRDNCPLYMPPDFFYHQTKREAVEYWNRRTSQRFYRG